MQTRTIGAAGLLGFALLGLMARSAVSLETSGPAAMVEIDPLRADDLRAMVLETYPLPTPELPARRLATTQRSRPGPSVANRNANPLNIKFGENTRGYVEAGAASISEIAPLDGGRFLKFRSPSAGFRAAVHLLTSRPYRDLDLHGAFRRWSNNGFGAEILAGTTLDARTKLAHLGAQDFKQLLGAMAAAEGYRSATLADEIATALRP